MSQTIALYAQYTASKAGLTGLADVTVDIIRITRSDGTASEVVTAGACTEVGHGVYVYRYASADLTLYDYAAIFHTASATADLKDIAALWTHYPLGRDTELARLDENVSAAKTLTAAYDKAKTAAAPGDVMGKSPATLNAADVSGNLPADVKAYTVQPTVTDATLSSAYDAAKTAAPAASAVADAVWDEATSGHTAAGSFGAWASGLVAAILAALTAGTAYLAAIAAAVWANATRTLTASPSATAAAVQGTTINITRDVTYTGTLTGITYPALWTRLYLSVKASLDDADAQSYVQLRLTKAGALSELLYIERAAYATATDGVLVADEAAQTLAITIKDEATAGLGRHASPVYGVKFICSDGSSTEPYQGTANIGYAVTRSLT
jgi:hypothetical protein